ncbi:hypothetical protein [Methylobacterium persicinum]|uniref:CopG family transcriptional regulator n=1 Tax=Methylobacterium persicinum TaxID=374426 RepID=A0ABU0HI92_9HYPH|nr:hypothetical protein [Methylobacterium persicinum]MDQ0441191.1 hypothetical protein [Methylobacterium persicinum]GJE40562.1 hypothetical protein KHHGKMAE_4657 [Methylobacterium persicinum]
MLTITVSLDDVVLQRAQEDAAREGTSLSEFIAKTVEQRVGRPTLPQSEAMKRFLAGPPLHVLDANGKAPTRDQMYDDD